VCRGTGLAPWADVADSVSRIRIAALGDLHYSRSSQGTLIPYLSHVHDHADVLVLCGDLTDYGLPEEAAILARDLQAAVRIPMVGVLGNHDYESGQQAEVTTILRDAGLTLLDGDTTEIKGVGFAGVKGFCGGFGRGVLGAWGESATKQFVNEAIAESLKLESALARLRTPAKVAILHYAPVRDTVEGEPLEIFPYLGCSRRISSMYFSSGQRLEGLRVLIWTPITRSPTTPCARRRPRASSTSAGSATTRAGGGAPSIPSGCNKRNTACTWCTGCGSGATPTSINRERVSPGAV